MTKKMKMPVLALAVIVAVLGLVGQADAHSRGGGWITSSCGVGSSSSGLCSSSRRGHHHSRGGGGGYDYHRRPRDAIDLVSDIFSVPIYMNSLFRQQVNNKFTGLQHQHSDPRYAIAEHEKEDGLVVELTMEVPGVSAKDITVEVVESEDGNILRVQGSRTIRESGSLIQTEFDQSFQLDKYIDVENIKVSLSSGILRVSALKKKVLEVTRTIPIAIKETEEAENQNIEVAGTRTATVTSNKSPEIVKKEDKEQVDTVEEDLTITEE